MASSAIKVGPEGEPSVGVLEVRNFIAGQFVPAASGQWLDNIEPATGAVYSRVADSDSEDVRRAYEAASAAFPGWAQTPREHRARLLNQVAHLVETQLVRFYIFP